MVKKQTGPFQMGESTASKPGPLDENRDLTPAGPGWIHEIKHDGFASWRIAKGVSCGS